MIDSYRGAPNLARLVSVSVRAFHGLMSDSARRRLWSGEAIMSVMNLEEIQKCGAWMNG